MTIEDISSKIAEKNKRISELNKKINALKFDIESLERQKQASIESGDPDIAIKLTKARRDKEDELAVLCQVEKSLASTPAVTRGEFSETWRTISADLTAQLENDILPELEAAYNRYCKAVAALRQKAQHPAAELEKMARGEGLNMVLPNPFLGIDLYDYYPNREYLSKLKCLDNGILNIPIAHPYQPD